MQTVFSEQGRGDEGTDPDGSFLAEFFVPLKPFDQWPKGLTKEKLVKQLSERLNREFVGVDFNFSQYIQDNIEEAVSGVKGENSIKIFGRDLAELERLSKSVKTELAKVPGVADPGGFNLLGQPNLVIRIDRAKAARYGFSVGDINAVVQAAIGGQEVTRVYEGEMNFGADGAACAASTAAMSMPSARSRSRCRIRDPKAPTAYIALGDLGEVKLEQRRGLHLPREQPALHSAEVQRARPRSRLDRGRSAGAHRQERAAAARATAWNGRASSARCRRPRSGWR